MRLLLDENLSRRLVPFLQSAYPGSSHVALLGLEGAADREIWEFARDHDFVIVTKDSDFYDLSLVLGAPPFVLWIQTGNANKSAALGLLLNHAEAINSSMASGSACVELTG